MEPSGILEFEVLKERAGHRYGARIVKFGHRWTIRIAHMTKMRGGVWRVDPCVTERRDQRKWTRRAAERYADREVDRRLQQSVTIDELMHIQRRWLESQAVQQALDSPSSFISPDVMASWGAIHVDNKRYYVVLADGTWNLVVVNPAGEVIA